MLVALPSVPLGEWTVRVVTWVTLGTVSRTVTRIGEAAQIVGAKVAVESIVSSGCVSS